MTGLVSHELTAYLSVFNLFLTNELWSYYQKDVNQITLNYTTLKRSFTNIRGLCFNFDECESFLESNSRDILALCERNLDVSIDSGNFSVRGYLPFIRIYFIAHMHGPAGLARKKKASALSPFSSVYPRRVVNYR